MPERSTTFAFVGPFPPIPGGIAQHAHQLVAAIEDSGRNVTVVSWRSQYPRVLYPGSQAIMAKELSNHTLRWWAPWTWVQARRRISDADVVVFPWVSPVHSIQLRVILGGQSRRQVAIVHNALPHENLPLAKQSMRWVLRRVDGIVVHSASVATELQSILEKHPILTVPHPANLPLQSTPLRQGRPRVLFFGYIRPYKGVDLLIEAVAALRARGQDVVVTVAGESWQDPEELTGMAERLGVSDLIEFEFGYVTDDGVAKLLEEHHLVVQPYRSASQSGVIPLAFAAGRPVVVTPVGGLAESVDSGVNGVVAEAATADALADALTVALSELDTLALGAAAASANWSDVVSAVLEAAELGAPEIS